MECGLPPHSYDGDMELGITTFGELTPDPNTGKTISAGERICNLIEEIELADRVGLEVFGVGEHHRPDFAVSAPAVVFAAAAARTKSIRLASAVTVLSSDDPVRVYQDFATLDLLSRGRAEIWAGRGSFIESSRSSGRTSITTTRSWRRSSGCCSRCARRSG